MAYELVLAVGGMALLAAGVWRVESRPQRAGAALAMLVCLCGIVIIAIATAQSEPRWSLRLAILCTYAGVGGLLGVTTAAILARRRTGAILATIGMVVPVGSRILWAGVVSIGMLSVVLRIVDAQTPASLVALIGQALFFVIFGIQAVLMAGTRWVLAEQGIIGPKVFVPWQQILAYGWQDSNTLGIETKPGFRGPRKFTVSIVPETRERAAAILACKIPGHW
jgi:hypothetical protein